MAQVVDQPQAAQLVLHKRDAATDAPLADAVFTIYEDTGGQLGAKVQTVTTDAKGQAAVNDLAWAKRYWAVETKAPVGYALPDPSDAKHWQSVTFTASQLTVERTFADAMQPITIRLNKIASGTGEQLPGATFALTGTDYVQQQRSASSSAQGWNLQFTGLQPGHTYTLKELTAPAGYVLDEQAHAVVVAKDGRQVTIDGKPFQVSLTAAGNIAGNAVIENHLKPLLPHTGGHGWLGNSLIALALLSLAAGLAYTKRRKPQP